MTTGSPSLPNGSHQDGGDSKTAKQGGTSPPISSPVCRNGKCWTNSSEAHRAQDLPALVGIKMDTGSVYRVIFGNRRLHGYKKCAETRDDVWYRMIVHHFPKCPALRGTVYLAHHYLCVPLAYARPNYRNPVTLTFSPKRSSVGAGRLSSDSCEYR